MSNQYKIKAKNHFYSRFSLIASMVIALLGYAPLAMTTLPPLSTSETQAITEALEDEYKARAFYQSVIDKFGMVRPFSNIVEAEGRHAALVADLFTKYGQTIPKDTFLGKVSAPATLLEACEAGVKNEQENRALYDRLLTSVTETDIRAVLELLRTTSQENHLPAFERCQQRLSQ